MSRRRRGFAMIYALTLLGLVAMALYVLADHFRFQVSRTTNTQADAQLHQILLVENDYVTVEAAKWPEQIDFKSVKLNLPTGPVRADVTTSIKLLSTEAGGAKVEVSAAGKSREAVENLTLKFSDGHWHVTAVELIGE